MKRVVYLQGEKPGPEVLLLAGVHGDEYEPMVALAELAAEIGDRLLAGSVRIVPLSNAGAYRSAGRYGEDGLDLARVCPGSETGSATEQAAYAVSSLIRQADVLIDLHTGGLALDIFPMIGYMLHPDNDILAEQQRLAAVSGMPLIWGTDYRPSGRTLSVARDVGVPAVYLEYGGGTGFRHAVAEAYKAAIKRMLVYLGLLETKDSEPVLWAYWLEDGRPDSGYLQGKTPSPADGIFMTDVKVGEQVKAGQRIGVIYDPLTGSNHIISARHDGVVLFIRLLVKVQKGDALAHVLPVKERGKKEVISE